MGLLLATVQVGNEGEALVGYIQELLVHPAYRRLGVAMHLLDAAERYFLDEHAFDRIELATSPGERRRPASLSQPGLHHPPGPHLQVREHSWPSRAAAGPASLSVPQASPSK